jgi:hypothetical protein
MNGTMVANLTNLIQYRTSNFGQSNKARERTKRETNREGRIKLLLLANDMIYLKMLKTLAEDFYGLINSAKYHSIKSICEKQLIFYIPIMNSLRKKSRKQSHSP